jgi:Kyakuja-Dileera-Zisupton transposase
VNNVRNVNGAKRRKATVAKEPAEEEEDAYEHPELRLPRSVLDGCEASFKAADEKREKASTEFFEDTAIMALLCRHDRVLWLVNMHSAGEKQFYVLTLLETLFQHLPPDVRVGLLYDIVCAFERSCRKWGFLSRFMDRLAFAVSVFHEWACQLLYHPRKREGFGFTNGEGAERFWHSISHLIANLHISGVGVILFYFISFGRLITFITSSTTASTH